MLNHLRPHKIERPLGDRIADDTHKASILTHKFTGKKIIPFGLLTVSQNVMPQLGKDRSDLLPLFKRGFYHASSNVYKDHRNDLNFLFSKQKIKNDL